MRFVKGISLFFVYPLVVFGIGYFAGLTTLEFFYPGSFTEEGVTQPGGYNPMLFIEDPLEEDNFREEVSDKEWGDLRENAATQAREDFGAVDVVSNSEVLDGDTRYVLWETDLARGVVVEIAGEIPAEYIGLNRAQFAEAMSEYELFPPLSEMERGFVGLEIVSFSRERVIVQMNYRYLQPSESFYLAVRDNEVIVLLEDGETVFINTGILLEELPEKMQLEIIQMYWLDGEEALYSFLENYSS